MVDYGTDLSCTDDLNPLLKVVSGVELMKEVVFRRLYCRPGNLLSNPLDNTIDVRDFLNGAIGGELTLERINGMCQAAIMGDNRIYKAIVQSSFDRKSGLLQLAINCVGSVGPFDLVIQVSALTVELLRQS